MNNSFLIPALLLSFAASLLLFARCVWRVGFGDEKRTWIGAFFAVSYFGATVLIAIDLLHMPRFNILGDFDLLSDVAILFLFAATTIYAFLAFRLHDTAIKLRRSIHSWILVLLTLTMSGWTYHRVQSQSSCVQLLGFGGDLPGIVEREEGAWAITDEGASIPLFHLATDDIRFEEFASLADQRFKSYAHVMIHREDSDKTTNCHGWVFTGGRFLLKGIDVERILCDNHYVIVSDPRPNDIVIYRDHVGTILHTALVQAILTDGTVITESKWGIDQRFLHLPVDQPYSPIFAYYRTDRPNHHLIRLGTLTDSEHLRDD